MAHLRKNALKNENALLDRDGFPPCAMTVDEFVAHVRATFNHVNHRIIAFTVRSHTGASTLTTRRGQTKTVRATKAEVAAASRTRAEVFQKAGKSDPANQGAD